MDFAKIAFICFLIVLFAAKPQDDETSPIHQNDLGDATSDFWKSFEDYKLNQIENDKDVFATLWSQIIQEKSKKLKPSYDDQVQKLANLITSYQEYLDKYKDKKIDLYSVLYNAALASYKLGNLSKEDDPEGARLYQEKAIGYLNQIDSSKVTNLAYEESLYLKALVFKSIGQDQDMMKVWKNLSSITKGSAYGVYANIALGDHEFFLSSITDTALGYYLKAYSSLTPKINFIEEFGLDYRILWASYRAGRNDLVLQKSKDILSKEYPRESLIHIQKIRLDIADLLGNISVNHLKDHEIKSLLSDVSIKDFGCAIALSAMKRYVILNENKNAITIGQYAADRFLSAKEYPLILEILSSLYSKQNNIKMKIEVDAKFVWLIPEKSLWRNRYKDSPKEIDMLVSTGRKLVQDVAEWYAQEGAKNSDIATYSKSAQAYGALIESYPIQTKKVFEFKRKQAEVYFYGKNYSESEAIYNSLLAQGPLRDEDEEFMRYKLIMIDEINWRNLFQRSLGVVTHDVSKLEINSMLKKWKSDVEIYSSKFKSSPKSWDLVLMVASAYRDSGLIKQSEDMWKELLVNKNPSPAQRAVAIRGVVASAIVNESHEKQVSLLLSFLRLENWMSYDTSLKNELLGVLSAACLKHAQKLQSEGKLKQATDLLLSITKEFPDIHNRLFIWREGTALGATASMWKLVEEESKKYLSSDDKENSEEMLYLLGISQEAQFHFSSAHATFSKLAKLYPNFAKSKKVSEKINQLKSEEKNKPDVPSIIKTNSIHLPTSWSL